MKKSYWSSYVLVLVAISCLFAACQSQSNNSSQANATAGTSGDFGQLTIMRSANLAEMLILRIDNGKPSTVRVGDSFSTPLSSGQHVISALLEPNQLNLAPTTKTLNVKKGQSYTLTAAWQNETLVLQ